MFTYDPNLAFFFWATVAVFIMWLNLCKLNDCLTLWWCILYAFGAVCHLRCWTKSSPTKVHWGSKWQHISSGWWKPSSRNKTPAILDIAVKSKESAILKIYRLLIVKIETATHPVEGVMMQPPRSTVTLQPHPLSGVSWFIPKLCPSSWARVTAAPSGLSEWSCKNKYKTTTINHAEIHLSPIKTSLLLFNLQSDLSSKFQGWKWCHKQGPTLKCAQCTVLFLCKQ